MPILHHTTLEDLLENWRANGLNREIEKDLISLECWVTSVDITFYKGTVDCVTDFWGVWGSNYSTWRLPHNLTGRTARSSESLITNATLAVYFNGQTSVFAQGDATSQKQYVFGFGPQFEGPTQVDVAEYPDVRLSFNLDVQAFLRTGTGDVYVEPELPVLLRLSSGFLTMYDVTQLECNNNTDAFVTITGVISIDAVALRMAKDVLNAVMWMLAGSVLCASIVWLFVRHEDAYITLASVTASLLFALPGMRNLLPAAPQSSTNYDFLNIYGQLVLVGIALFLHVIKGMLVLLYQWSAYKGKSGQFYCFPYRKVDDNDDSLKEPSIPGFLQG